MWFTVAVVCCSLACNEHTLVLTLMVSNLVVLVLCCTFAYTAECILYPAFWLDSGETMLPNTKCKYPCKKNMLYWCLSLWLIAVGQWWYVFRSNLWWWCLVCPVASISCCWSYWFYSIGQFLFKFPNLQIWRFPFLSDINVACPMIQFPKLLEVVGLGYTIWFSTRYLIFKVVIYLVANSTLLTNWLLGY